jgi:hypothetical protein
VEPYTRLWVSIDWSKVPLGENTGSVQISGAGWGAATIAVSAFKPDLKKTTIKGFAEADGYIAIDAEHYQRQGSAKDVSGQQLHWEKIPQHGRSLSSMSVYPIGDQHFESPEQAPYLEYDIFTTTKSKVAITGLFAPSWPMLPQHGLRYAIAVDDQPAQIIDLTSDMSSTTWEETVRSDVRRSTSTHEITTPGAHKLRIYSLDPGVTLQKIMLDTGGLLPSYLGPDESHFY